ALSAMSVGSLSGAATAMGDPRGAAARAGTRGLLGTRVLLWPAVAIAALVAAAAWWTGRSERAPAVEVAYKQLTFRSGIVSAARFTPDGETVVYAAAWEGKPTSLFTARVGSPESRPLGIEGADLLSISKSGELAILRDAHYIVGWMRRGTLARASLAGGTPREVMQDVEDADWAPDGEGLAVVRSTAAQYRLEYPPGKMLYETDAWVSSPRFSHDGRRIAFIDHPGIGDDRGRIGVVDLQGRVRFLTEPFASARGVAWTSHDDAIWFSAGRVGNVRAIQAVDFEGRVRVVDGAPTSMTLADISAGGRTLVTRDSARRGIIGTSPGDTVERDLSWLDWSRPAALSPDGRQIVFEEQGQGGGEGYSVYLRPTDGGPAVRLGRGSTLDLSRDGRWVLTATVAEPDRLDILPTGAGEARPLTLPGFEIINAWFQTDSRRLVVLATEKGHGARLYAFDPDAGAAPRPLTPEGIGYAAALSQNGKQVAAAPRDGAVLIWPLDGGDPAPLAGSEPGDIPLQWSRDDRTVFVAVRQGQRARLDAIDVPTGRRSLFRTIEPADRAGLIGIDFFLLSADQRAYAYSYRRVLSALYQVEGLP
ncbi:MAG TPA: hypothetical protein VMQ62_13665, partial [Dongiaceae bacterium]|nr:hypothetical protein [Dongiaceae bacterium]